MTKWHGGKGSTYKPYDKDKFDKNFDRIFKKNKPITELNNVIEVKNKKKNGVNKDG